MSLEPRREYAIIGLVALSFTALGAALFFPALFEGRLVFGFDTVALGLPFHAEVLRSLGAGEWPLWMPDILGGMPGVASCNLFFTYPTAFFGSLARLPFPFLLGLDAALNVAAAGLGMFLLLRRMRLSPAAGLLGAAFFALSGSVISQLYGGYLNLMEGVAWTPWIFWAAHKGIREKSRFAWGLCGAALALQVLAVASQLCLYATAALALFTLAAGWEGDAARPPLPGERKKALGGALAGLGLSFLLAALLAAPQLWPTVRYLPYATHQGWSRPELLDGAIGPSEALAWVVPGFFGWQWRTYHGGMAGCFTSEYLGLLPWCLAAGALGSLWERNRWVRRLAALCLTAFFFAQNRWTPFYPLFQHLPVLAGFRIWSRTLFLNTFAVCILAALGWDALSDPGTRPRALRWALGFLVLAVAVEAAAWLTAPGQVQAGISKLLKFNRSLAPQDLARLTLGLARDSALRSLELTAALLALLALFALRPLRTPALIAALAFHACDQSCVYNRFVNFIDPQAAVARVNFSRRPPPPAGLEPWRLYDSNTSYPNNSMLLGYENLAGRESMPLRSFLALTRALSGSAGTYYDLMDERYLFSHTRPDGGPGDRVSITQNGSAFPRAWLVGRSRTVPSDAAAYRLLADPGFNPRLEATLPVDLGLGLGAPAAGSVRWLLRSPQAFTLSVSSARPAALVVSNFWYPAWTAEVDGAAAPVLKADGALQAVALPEGTHEVGFRYDESLFDDALAACLAGCFLLLGLGWLEFGAGKRR